jgi:hypothetical protein
LGFGPGSIMDLKEMRSALSSRKAEFYMKTASRQVLGCKASTI